MVDLQTITQFFWVSATTMLPISILSILYGKLTGQIVFRIKEKLSPFQQKLPNPAIKIEDMRWLKDQEHFFESTEEPEKLTQEKLVKEDVSKMEDEAKYTLIDGQLKRIRPDEKKIKTDIPEKRGRGRPRKDSLPQKSIEKNEESVVFETVEQTLVGKVSENFKGKTKNGIPIEVEKGTPVQIVVKGKRLRSGKSEDEEEEKREKVEDLSGDPNLGAVGEGEESA